MLEVQLQSIEKEQSCSVVNKIRFDDIVLEERLGSGAHAEVYKGKLWGTTSVAVKVVHNVDSTNQFAFLHEAEIMEGLRNHPNVVSFFGVVTTPSALYIVTEFVPNGSLESFLRSNVDLVPTAVLLQMAQCVCAGMDHLHRHGIIHRDLATRNLLLEVKHSGEHLVKVCDFGLSRASEQMSYYKGRDETPIPVRWTAPEALRWHRFTPKSDVWSFGVVLWELFTFGEEPYSGLSNREVIAEIKAGRRLEKPQACPSPMYEMMQTCWAEDPEKRPIFADIYKLIFDHLQLLEPLPDNSTVLLDKKHLRNVVSETSQDTYEAELETLRTE